MLNINVRKLKTGAGKITTSCSNESRSDKKYLESEKQKVSSAKKLEALVVVAATKIDCVG